MSTELATCNRLKEISSAYREKYLKSYPFKHIIIDNFFDKDGFEYLHSLFPGAKSNAWKMPSNVHTVNKRVIKRGYYDIKEQSLSVEARNALRYLNSATFIDFLEKTTLIKGLCPDPYLFEAGFHLSTSGSKLDIHADYSHHDRLGLERRLNVLIYLNREWDTVLFGGNLKLYDRNLNEFASIEPIANRVVIFETGRETYHGFPEPITTTKAYESAHIGRKSVAMYYYTVCTGREKHRIIFPQDPAFTFDPTCE